MNPRFFLHNDSLEVLETFDFGQEYITQIVRVRRRADMPDEADLKGKEVQLLSRYNLSYFQVLRRDEERREFTALIKQRMSGGLKGIFSELELEAFPALPTIIEEDESVISFCAREDEMAKVLKVLGDLRLPFDVRSLSDYVPPESEWSRALTERQQEVLRLALQMGYYEVPARASLTRLAEVVGVSKAAMSKMFRRAEGKLLRSLIKDE